MYDIVIAGGGAAGCVIAGKLAAASPSLKILVLETGPHSLDVPVHVQPGRFYSNLIDPKPTRESLTLHVAKPAEAVAGRSIVAPSGRVVGGGSAVNYMVYTRASASDYDAWKHQFGNPGWGSEDLIPLLKGVETYEPFASNDAVGLTHGIEGPLNISAKREHINLAEQFLDVAGKYDTARPVGEDFNDFNSGDKYARWPKYIDAKTGRRSDTAHAFIYSQSQNPNLVVEIDMRVVRVLFDGTRASGVEYIDGSHRKATGQRVVKSVFASKLVILCAGAFGSPAILERSGIGSAEVLRSNDIPQLVELPGVGEHFMDHNLIFTQYHASDEVETIDDIFYGTPDEISVHEAEWMKTGQGLLSHNGFNGGGKLRPTAGEIEEMGAGFKKRWETFFARSPDKPVIFAGSMAAYCGSTPVRPPDLGKVFTILYYSAYPESIGRVHIAGGLDPYVPLDYETGYLEDEGDLDVFRWGYKHVREIARRMPFYRGELEGFHPSFPQGTAVALSKNASPVPIEAPKLRYSKEDDAAIDEYHRKTVGTAWHACGTCAMKSRESGGVVDSNLNVYGTTNLKVADMSICPENVGANTYNTALAIGLKAAEIIAKELGLSL